MPHADFYHEVDDFNEWKEIWDQHDYESRLNTEADLMISLEALRESLVQLDYYIDDLEECISDNDSGIEHNDYGIHDNDDGIYYNDEEIDNQRYRVDRLNRTCKYMQGELEDDLYALELYCQQFAWAPDMVGACADILTCAETQISYRADVFHHYYEHIYAH